MPMAFDLASYNDVRTNAKTWDFVGRLGIEPRTQGLKVCCSECRVVPGNDG
jgi:hypothetical protein